jgi:hypothetical protein
VAYAAVAATLPRRRRVEDAAVEGGLRGYLTTLRSGVAEAATRPAVRGLVLFIALVPAIGAVDEYVPLLGPAYHMSRELVPLLLLALTVAAALGSWAAGRWWPVPAGAMAALLGVAAAGLLVAGAVRVPAGYAGVVVAYAVTEFALVAGEIRLQHAITGPDRATVTSVASLGTEIASLLVFVGCAVLGGEVSLLTMIGAFALPVAVLAVATRRWLRTPGQDRRSGVAAG